MHMRCLHNWVFRFVVCSEIGFCVGIGFEMHLLKGICNRTSTKGSTVDVSATTPSNRKYAVSTVLTRSLGKNLKRQNSPNKTHEPTMGKRIASPWVMVSAICVG